MHSSRMSTARSSSRPGGVSTSHPPRGADPPGAGTPPSRPPRPGTPPVNRITNTCKNITFPQLRLQAVINRVWIDYRHIIIKVCKKFLKKTNVSFFIRSLEFRKKTVYHWHVIKMIQLHHDIVHVMTRFLE